MPEDKRDKRSNPKEQRRPRHGRQQPQAEKKVEKKPEETKPTPNVPQKPEYEAPGPEFYKNLKRETDEILKITEEENTKYKKKEIQSNWSKYEMPIETYEEIEEQENLGADYEKLIQAPLSVGGHFQFKHEKSWDLNTAPSLYDKYFEIDMDNLSLALSTIPFYQRNSIDKTVFTETDMLNMNNRATRFKQKYYNDKTYTTPEMEASDKILSSLKESSNKLEDNKLKHISTESNTLVSIENLSNEENKEIVIKNIQDEIKDKSISENMTEVKLEPSIKVLEEVNERTIKEDKLLKTDRSDSIKDNNFSNKETVISKCEPQVPKVEMKNIDNTESQVNNKEIDFDDFVFGKVEQKNPKSTGTMHPVSAPVPKDSQTPPEPKKNPVIESPEDLEKWLDDFLDG